MIDKLNADRVRKADELIDRAEHIGVQGRKEKK
jgi:hypothetical protein